MVILLTTYLRNRGCMRHETTRILDCLIDSVLLTNVEYFFPQALAITADNVGECATKCSSSRLRLSMNLASF